MGTTRGVEQGNERGFICVWLKWVWLSKQTSASLDWFLRAQRGSSGEHRSAGVGVERQRTGELTQVNDVCSRGVGVIHRGENLVTQVNNYLDEKDTKFGADQGLDQSIQSASLVRCETLGVGTAFAALVYATCQLVLAWNDRGREN